MKKSAFFDQAQPPRAVSERGVVLPEVLERFAALRVAHQRHELVPRAVLKEGVEEFLAGDMPSPERRGGLYRPRFDLRGLEVGVNIE